MRPFRLIQSAAHVTCTVERGQPRALRRQHPAASLHINNLELASGHVASRVYCCFNGFSQASPSWPRCRTHMSDLGGGPAMAEAR